jgi:RNA polymerase sigma-70 factor (ECF subfamily)
MESIATTDTTASDRDLIDAARRGEQFGFEQLVERYQNRLFVAMRNDVGCSILAEDIVQEAFVRAFRFLDSFRCHSNFYTWLYRIALNSRRDYTRNRGRMVSLETVSESSRQVLFELDDAPDNCIERTEEQQQVRDALARLAEHHRRILILREFEGFDYQSIADLLHLNLGTVRSRLARARTQLRKELTAYVSAKPVSAGSTVANNKECYLACAE